MTKRRRKPPHVRVVKLSLHKRPGDYEVRAGGVRVACVLACPNGWRVCEPTETSRTGIPVSPLEKTRLNELRRWVKERYAERQGEA
jgi:hypothetical protein